MDNPYASPHAVGEVADAVAGPVRPASQGLRFANLIVDTIVTQIISAGAGFVLGIMYALSRTNSAAPLTRDEDATLRMIGFMVGIACFLVYFIITEGLWQRSVAKLITGTRVVNIDGGRPSFGQIVGRTFARLIPFEAFSFFGGKGFPVGWHDSLSKTRVIKAR